MPMFQQYNSIFQQYSSIAEIVQSGAIKLVQEELNATPLYVQAVAYLKLREIGIIVEGEQKKIVGKYASHNAADGKIEEIVDFHTHPDLTVRVREGVLMDILYHVEEVKRYPRRSFFRYARHFSMKSEEYWKLAGYVTRTLFNETQPRA